MYTIFICETDARCVLYRVPLFNILGGRSDFASDLLAIYHRRKSAYTLYWFTNVYYFTANKIGGTY